MKRKAPADISHGTDQDNEEQVWPTQPSSDQPNSNGNIMQKNSALMKEIENTMDICSFLDLVFDEDHDTAISHFSETLVGKEKEAWTLFFFALK
ncbi:hypothetical protein QQP08_012810 [Theobroma cacao]|nr:hypothetical protein QQP08_012810 [Theobroma cacao]